MGLSRTVSNRTLNLNLEKAAALFNLGAVYSQTRLSVDRLTVKGRRQAMHNFVGAGGAFAYLRDNVAVKAVAGGLAIADVSVECAGMLERLMLAHAQECVFENTIATGSSPGVCAKISRQIGAGLLSLAKPITSLDANGDAIVGALKLSLRQLETLGAQRAGLEDILTEMKRKDDVIPKSMVSTGSYEDLLIRR